MKSEVPDHGIKSPFHVIKATPEKRRELAERQRKKEVWIFTMENGEIFYKDLIESAKINPIS